MRSRRPEVHDQACVRAPRGLLVAPAGELTRPPIARVGSQVQGVFVQPRRQRVCGAERLTPSPFLRNRVPSNDPLVRS